MGESHPPSAEVVRLPLDPDVRLRAALRMLAVRLGEQRRVMSDWRNDTLALSRTIDGLAGTLASCQASFDALDAKVAMARSAACELERTADHMLEGSGSA